MQTLIYFLELEFCVTQMTVWQKSIFQTCAVWQLNNCYKKNCLFNNIKISSRENNTFFWVVPKI